jgi:hypothetical protein
VVDGTRLSLRCGIAACGQDSYPTLDELIAIADGALHAEEGVGQVSATSPAVMFQRSAGTEGERGRHSEMRSGC